MFLKRLFGMLPPDPFVDGLKLMESGELRQAIAAFELRLSAEDEGVRSMAALYACEAWLQLGNDLADLDRAEALLCYEKAAALEPEFADVQHRVGRTRLLLGDLEGASEALGRAIEINGSFLAAHLDLLEVEIRSQSDRWSEHLEFLESTHGDLFADDLASIRGACESADWSSAVTHVDSLRERNPSRRQRLKEAAVRALRLGEPEEAIRQLDSMLRTGRRYPDLLHLKGLALAELGDHAEAERAFRDALEIHPKFTKARVNLALTLMESMRWSEAERELEVVLEQDPTHPLAHGALEEIRSSVGEQ